MYLKALNGVIRNVKNYLKLLFSCKLDVVDMIG